MINRRFALEIILLFALNLGISFLFRFLIPNVYLADILVSVVLAFIFAIVEQWEDRIHFFKYQRFWYNFFITGIIFCLIDLLLWII